MHSNSNEGKLHFGGRCFAPNYFSIIPLLFIQGNDDIVPHNTQHKTKATTSSFDLTNNCKQNDQLTTMKYTYYVVFFICLLPISAVAFSLITFDVDGTLVKGSGQAAAQSAHAKGKKWTKPIVCLSA